MMNFEKDRIEKLRRTDEQHRSAADLMIPGEASIGVYKGSDFQVTFTDRKVLIVNVRGITGKKIVLKNRIDSAVLGGVRLDYDGQRLDDTVSHRMDAIRDLLNKTVL